MRIAWLFAAVGAFFAVSPANASVIDLFCKNDSTSFDYWIDTGAQTVSWLWTNPQSGASSLLWSRVSTTAENYSWNPAEGVYITVYRATGVMIMQNTEARPQIVTNAKCELGSKPIPTPNPHPAPKF